MPASAREIQPTDARATAFWWLADTLQADPVLGRYVRNWYLPDGTTNYDNDLPAGVTSVRLRPTYEPPGEIAVLGGGRILQQMPVLVQVETRVDGIHGDTPINLWGLIETAAWPDTPARREAMRCAGVSWIEFVQTAAMPAAPPAVGQGAIRLMVAVAH